MAQTFLSTYQYDYRRHPFQITKPILQIDEMAEKTPKGDMWIVRKKLPPLGEPGSENEDMKAIEAQLHKMFMDVYFTTYQVGYCHAKRREEDEEDSSVNALLQYCRKLYAPKTSKILPPLATSRRVFGFLKPERMYTSDTTYQHDYGKIGYDILEDSHKRTKEMDAAKEL